MSIAASSVTDIRSQPRGGYAIGPPPMHVVTAA